MTMPSTRASPTRGTAMSRLRLSEASCAMPTSSIRSRLTITRPQNSPIAIASGQTTPTAMCTANAAESTARPPVDSSTPPSATNRARAPGATARMSPRAPASTASALPIRPRRRAILASSPDGGFGGFAVVHDYSSAVRTAPRHLDGDSVRRDRRLLARRRAMQTRFTRLVGCSVPIQQDPMGAISSPELAVAVADAGGVGTVTSLGAPPDAFLARLDELRSRTGGILSANVLAQDVDAEFLTA